MGRRIRQLLATLVFAFLIIASMGSVALASITYSGTLTTSGEVPGLTTVGQWTTTDIVVLGWNVSQNSDGLWHYVYSFNVQVPNNSPSVIELPTTATSADLLNAYGSFSSYSVGLFEPGPSCPNLPGPIYGVCFLVTDELTPQVSFDSYLAPGFGNYYGQEPAGTKAAYNEGFLIPSTHHDPVSGTINNKVLVPDPDPIPDASTIVLACFGALQLLAIKQKVFSIGG